MNYRTAEAADAVELAAFAERVFVSSYEDRLPRAELESFAQSRFTAARQQEDIGHADHHIFLAFDPQLIGYAHLITGAWPECPLGASAPAELKRLYIDAGWHGRGVAQRLLELAESSARERHCDALWLAVWADNERAIRFYEKTGFVVIGSQDFQVGSMLLGHHYMAKNL